MAAVGRGLRRYRLDMSNSSNEQQDAPARSDGDRALTWILRAILILFSFEMLTGPFHQSELWTAAFFYGCVFGARALARTLADSRASL
jgi:hypothetical protein